MPREVTQHSDLLTPERREAAWRLAFTDSLDNHPDAEIAWEARYWRQQGARRIAAVCDELLAERRRDSFSLPGGADAADLHRLLSRVNFRAVIRLVEDEGLCLVAAMRLVYWSGLAEVPRGASASQSTSSPN